MARLTEEDFSPVYMDVRKNGDKDKTWPKIVLWSLDTPLVYDNMQIMVTVLQRQAEPYGEWVYTASVKPNDHTMSTNDEDQYGTDPYAEIGSVTISARGSFADVIDGVYEEIGKLQGIGID